MTGNLDEKAVKEFLITPTLSPQEMAYTYANEADILNMALFGKTAAQWRNEKGISGKTPNIRDFASAERDKKCIFYRFKFNFLLCL